MEIKVGDIYQGLSPGGTVKDLCCAGYNWEVVLIFPNDNPGYNSIWGTCQRPACTGRDGRGTDPYQGVSSWLQEDIEEKLAEAQPGRGGHLT